MYKRSWKRVLDAVFAFCAIILFMPLIGCIALLVLIKMGRPVLFAQERPGRDGVLFTLYKFRSMSGDTGRDGVLKPDLERITPFGRALRDTSLDELPELWNILRGDMSFVGPRPLLVRYLPYYSSAENNRHTVRPGLTGLAQVNGRNLLNWEERFFYDLSYVEHITLWGDIAILLKTVRKVVRRSDIALRGTGKLIDFDLYRQTHI